MEVLYAPHAADAAAWFRENGPILDAVILSRHYVASTFLPLVRAHARRAGRPVAACSRDSEAA